MPGLHAEGTELRGGENQGFTFIGLGSRDVLRLSGRDALDLLHRLSTNDLSDLREGQVRETVLTTEKGRIVDLLTVGVFSDGLFVLCSRGRGEETRDWIEKFVIADDVKIERLTPSIQAGWFCSFESISPLVSLLGISLGPNSCLLNSEGPFRVLTLSGPRGYHLMVLGEHAQLEALIRQRDQHPVGPGLAELLRIQFFLPRAPNELNEGFTPYDVGLSDLLSFTKGCYVGQEVIARLRTYGKVRRGLASVAFPEKLSVTVPATLVNGVGESLGHMTSVAADRGFGRSYGLAVVKLDGLREGDEVRLEISPTTSMTGHIAGFSTEQHGQ